MKKKIVLPIAAILVVGISIAGIAVFGTNEDKAQDPAKAVSTKEAVDVAKNDAVKAAKKLNSVKDDEKFKEGVRDVLDYYYSNDKEKSAKSFASEIDSRGTEIADNYENAATERKKGNDNGYAVGEVCVVVDKDMTKSQLDKMAEKYRGKCTEVIDLSDTEKIAVFETSLEYTVAKSKDNYDKEDGVSYAQENALYEYEDIDESNTIKDTVQNTESTESEDTTKDAGGTAVPDVTKDTNDTDLKDTEQDTKKQETLAGTSELQGDSTKGNSDTNIQSGLATSDPYSSSQWFLGSVGASGAWATQKSVSTKKIKVAVIDTGCDMRHPDLQKTVSKKYSVRIYKGKYKKLTKLKNGDSHGHGTHVVGLVGATGNNSRGGTGVATGGTNSKISIIAVNVGSKYVRDSDAIRAVGYVYKKHVKVINMSFGSYLYGHKYSKALRSKIKSVYKKGVLCVCAAGNNNTTKAFTPGDSPYVTSVIALQYPGTYRASFSNYGKKKDISAPGTSMFSTWRGKKYNTIQGTSQASPVVAGTAAMVLSVKRMSPGSLKNVLYKTATDLGSSGKDIYTGYGRVNAAKAVFSVTKCTGVKATPASYSTINLKWNAIKGAGTTYYYVYCKKAGESSYRNLGYVASNSATITEIVTGKKYSFYIVAANNGTVNQKSAVVSAMTKLGTPAISSLTKSYNKVTVTWATVPGAGTYEVWRADSLKGTYSKITSTVANTYTNTGLAYGKTYYYKVRAVRSSEIVAYSAYSTPKGIQL